MPQARWLALSVGVMLIVASSAHAAEVPESPKGFSWKQVPEIKAAFLVPEGWHFLEETKEKTLAVFITRESIPDHGEFETGISINVIRDNPSAPKQLKEMIEGAASKHGSKVSTSAFEPFVRLNTRFDSMNKANGKMIRTLMIVIVNVHTMTSYRVIFETPVDQWGKSWPLGEVVVNMLALETEM